MAFFARSSFLPGVPPRLLLYVDMDFEDHESTVGGADGSAAQVIHRGSGTERGT